MQHTVRHDLDDATAAHVALLATESYKERYARFKPQVEWTSARHCRVRFHVRGATVTGEVELAPGAILLTVHVPLLLRPFRGQAIAAIEREVQRWIDKAKRDGL